MQAPWWDGAALARFVADLVDGELSRERRSRNFAAQPWPRTLVLDADLGVDSLERLVLATALAQALHLHESGIEDYLLARRTLGDWVDIAGAGLSTFSDRLTFRTSGSSGSPKPCVHALSSLVQETAHLARLFAGSRRVLCAVPSHHIYGFLFTVLLPRALGLPDSAVIDVRASTPAWLVQGAAPGDLVVGHPDYWKAVAQSVPRLPAGVVGVSSTAPCPEAVSLAVQQAGIERFVHIYGSSETAGIGSREGGDASYRLFPHWSFSADDANLLVRTAADGHRETFACQDRLERTGNDLFRVGARQDDAVQVGGSNVYPSRVASVLRHHPQVRDAAVRRMRPEEGSRLKAFVVPTPDVHDAVAFEADLRSWIDTQLSAPERPKALRFGATLPVNSSGKACDWSLDAEQPLTQH
jgi:long-chain acyl-CoA synthetase